MVLNNIEIVQSGNQYLLFLPTRICIAQILMPPDSQFIGDTKALDIITKAMAIRWGVYKHNGRK